MTGEDEDKWWIRTDGQMQTEQSEKADKMRKETNMNKWCNICGMMYKIQFVGGSEGILHPEANS